MKPFKFLLTLVVIFVLTSCNFTENIDVHPDGSGTFSLEMDGAGLMSMAGDKLGKELGAKNKAKAIDSTFSFKEMFKAKKDSIAKLSPEQQEMLKTLENFVMKIKMNPEAKQLLFSMNTPFKSVKELDGLMQSMGAMKNMKTKSDKNSSPASMLGGLANDNSKLSFSYDGKNFSRKAIVDKNAVNKIAADSTGMAKMIFASSKYTLKYHFPKAVKSVSNPNAMFSADRKTVIIEYPFTDYSQDPEKMNINVVFE